MVFHERDRGCQDLDEGGTFGLRSGRSFARGCGRADGENSERGLAAGGGSGRCDDGDVGRDRALGKILDGL